MARRTLALPARRGRRSLALIAATIATLLTITGCTRPDDSGGASPSVEISDSPVGKRTQWALDLINWDEEIIAYDLKGALDEGMLEAITLDELAETLNAIRANGPWTATDYSESGANATAILESEAADPLQLKLAVDDDGLIAGMLFSAAPAAREPSTTWDELTAALKDLPAPASFTVTQLTGADTAPVFVFGETGARPIGSMIKLWVLVAVVDAIERGALTWSTPLTVTDDLRSLPSGELQDEPTGTQVSVEDAALKMISISDNTAMDLLIAAVGRGAVEQTFIDVGNQDPGLNVPLLTSREAFQVGWSENGTLRDGWSRGDDEVRRAVIEGLPGGTLNVEARDVTGPAWHLGIDWFATAQDLVQVHAALERRADTLAGAPIRQIMGENPGLPFGDEWSYVAFKGGSSPGVLGGSWLLEREDGERYVITVQVASTNPNEVADYAPYFGPVQDAAAILASE